MLLRKDQLAELVTDESMLATPLVAMCLDAFGTDFFSWEPESFDLDCQQAFGTVLPQVNKDKIWALVTVLTTNAPYVSLETFIPICNVFNDTTASFTVYDPADSEEIAWTVTEILLNDPPQEGEDVSTRFSHEIKRYIAATLSTEGVTRPPRVLLPFTEYDRDPDEIASANMGPDEHMVQMYETRQTNERNAIEKYVSDRLTLLMEQIRKIPLTNSDTSQLARYLEQYRAGVISSTQPEVPAQERLTQSLF